MSAARLLAGLRRALPLTDEAGLEKVAVALTTECGGMRLPTASAVERAITAAERRIAANEEPGDSPAELAERLGVSKRQARRLRRGETH